MDDVEEIKKGQKDILAKLDGLEKSVQGIKAAGAAAAAPARPAMDPNTVYQLPVASSPVRGPKDAKVTIVEFADFQCPFCRRVEPTFWKYPKPCSTGLGMARISSVFVARNAPTFHPSVPMFNSLVPRRPASKVRETTCFSGGSETRNAAMMQGCAGSAHPSSSGVGARLASEYPA